MTLWRVLVLCFLLSLSWREVVACSCLAPRPFETRRKVGLEFLGRVRSLRTESKEVRIPGDRKRYAEMRIVATLQLLEDFSGRLSHVRLFEVRTGTGGGDCGYPFQVGERYLISAYEQEGSFWTDICSGTRTEAASGVRLRALRKPAVRATSDVTGAVLRYKFPHLGEFGPASALGGVPVLLTDLSGHMRRATTGADGVYEFPSVPAGAYGIQVQLPPQLTQTLNEPLSVVVPEAHGDAGCVVDVMVSPSGRLEGSLRSATGRVPDGSLQLYNQPPKSETSPVGYDFVKSDGRFAFTHLEPGHYWIVFTPGAGESAARWFYPGTSFLDNAQSVSLDGGETKAGLVLVVR